MESGVDEASSYGQQNSSLSAGVGCWATVTWWQSVTGIVNTRRENTPEDKIVIVLKLRPFYCTTFAVRSKNRQFKRTNLMLPGRIVPCHISMVWLKHPQAACAASSTIALLRFSQVHQTGNNTLPTGLLCRSIVSLTSSAPLPFPYARLSYKRLSREPPPCPCWDLRYFKVLFVSVCCAMLNSPVTLRILYTVDQPGRLKRTPLKQASCFCVSIWYWNNMYPEIQLRHEFHLCSCADWRKNNQCSSRRLTFRIVSLFKRPKGYA